MTVPNVSGSKITRVKRRQLNKSVPLSEPVGDAIEPIWSLKVPLTEAKHSGKHANHCHKSLPTIKSLPISYSQHLTNTRIHRLFPYHLMHSLDHIFNQSDFLSLFDL